MAKKGGLGKGLDALFLDNDAQVGEGLMSLRISAIEPNKDQPRDRFDQTALSELADSIRESFQASDVRFYTARALCSYYAEKGGLLVGIECPDINS